jgi:hypothetical protein
MFFASSLVSTRYSSVPPYYLSFLGLIPSPPDEAALHLMTLKILSHVMIVFPVHNIQTPTTGTQPITLEFERATTLQRYLRLPFLLGVLPIFTAFLTSKSNVAFAIIRTVIGLRSHNHKPNFSDKSQTHVSISARC